MRIRIRARAMYDSCMTKQKDKIEYPRFQARLSQDNIDWLKLENNNFGSWNKFFNELRRRYDKRGTKTKTG